MSGITRPEQLEQMVRYINEDFFEMPTSRYFIDMARSATLLSILTVPAEDAAHSYAEAAIELYVGNAPLTGKVISSPIDTPDIQYPVTVLRRSLLTLQYCVEISPIGKLESSGIRGIRFFTLAQNYSLALTQ